VPHFNHQFQDIRAHGFELLRTALRAAASAGIDARTIDWFIPHQVNGRLPELCAAHLGLPGERVVCEADALGNLGSGAIWVALDRLRNSKRLAPNARVLVLGAEATKFLYGGFLYVHGTS
jgi:3-oxoacyl-[acyl-carrier-protein] synthase III